VNISFGNTMKLSKRLLASLPHRSPDLSFCFQSLSPMKRVISIIMLAEAIRCLNGMGQESNVKRVARDSTETAFWFPQHLRRRRECVLGSQALNSPLMHSSVSDSCTHDQNYNGSKTYLSISNGSGPLAVFVILLLGSKIFRRFAARGIFLARRH
jgi:hypothetical protein